MRINHCICFLVLLLAGCTDAPVEIRQHVKVPTTEPTVVKVQLDLSKIPTPCHILIPLLKGSENPSRLMAQIEQESSCNPFAVSPVGAMGLSQAMPDTLEWGARTFARHLGKPDINDPIYAIEFLKAYMVYFTVHPFDSYCDNKTVDEMRYNGGYWIIWEIKASNGTLRGAERICGVERLPNGKRRSLDNCGENYSYSPHIDRRQPKYLPMGGISCPNN